MRKKKEIPKSELIKHYCEEELSEEEVAVIYLCCRTTIHRRLIEAGIRLRNQSEALKSYYKKYPDGRSREKSGTWKGGKTIVSGYVRVLKPEHPRAYKNGYVAEHILAWEQANNKSLPIKWIVHHLNGIKIDNRPENLAAMPSKKHAILIPELERKIQHLEQELKSTRK